jgi:outer membrane protein assembly factor BamB
MCMTDIHNRFQTCLKRQWEGSTRVDGPTQGRYGLRRTLAFESSTYQLSMRNPSLPPSCRQPAEFRRILTAVAATSSFLLPSAVWADWPEFRGPAGDGKSEALGVPLRWEEKGSSGASNTNIAWKVPVPGRGWSSPVVAEGKIWLTTAVVTRGGEDAATAKSDRSLRALCLDLASGKQLWDVEVFAQDGSKAPDSVHRKNGHASPTAIFRDGKLYVHFGHQGSACLDAASGKKLWENRTFFYEPQHGNGSSPVLEEGRLIFSCDGREQTFVLALDAATGKEAWRFARPTEAKRKFAFASPGVFEIGGKRQVISPGADMVNALDPATGKELWRVAYEGYSVVPKPLFGHGLVFVCTSFDTPDVLAIRPEGSGDITEKQVVWEHGMNKRTPKTCSMLLDGELLYWVSDNGIFSCVEAKTGEIVYQERVDGEFSASPVLVGDRVYLQSELGKTTVVKTGRKFEVLAENVLQAGKTYASFAVVPGTLLIRGETDLYAIRDKK